MSIWVKVNGWFPKDGNSALNVTFHKIAETSVGKIFDIDIWCLMVVIHSPLSSRLIRLSNRAENFILPYSAPPHFQFEAFPTLMHISVRASQLLPSIIVNLWTARPMGIPTQSRLVLNNLEHLKTLETLADPLGWVKKLKVLIHKLSTQF